MMNRTFRDRAAVAMVVLATLPACQLVKKLTGRGEDSGTSRANTSPILGDAGGLSPVIALPNPTVSPLPSQPTPPPTPDVMVPPMPSPGGNDPNAQDADAGAPGPAIAVVDAGAVPPMDPRMRRRFSNFCKEHPGQMHPLTHMPCPM